jgi:hypothetical protein
MKDDKRRPPRWNFYTDAEKAAFDYRRGRVINRKKETRKLMDALTKRAPHELIGIFRLFGMRHNIPESEMMDLMGEISRIRSRKLVQNVFVIALNQWRALKLSAQGGGEGEKP